VGLGVSRVGASNPLHVRAKKSETPRVLEHGERVFTVQVRDLVEFVLRRGDLGGGGGFVGSDRALAGVRGQQRVQRDRPAGYRREVVVRHEVDTGEWVLRVQGRLDGVWVEGGEVWIEEIKTVRGGWGGEPDLLHWAQAKVYAHLYEWSQRSEVRWVRLTYLDLDTGKVTAFDECCGRADLAGFFARVLAVYLEWTAERHRWCRERDQSIRAMSFPFARYRAGQRELAVAVYQTVMRGGRLFMEAPTGIGKTAAVLFSALKAMGEGGVGRIFYLTARTVGRGVAEQALTELRGAGLRARWLTLTARDKVCVRGDGVCEVATCPLAIGYYDRCKEAMRAALGRGELTRPVLESVSREHEVCPFELSLDLSSWVDLVVCDYNHAFDPRVYLRRHFADPSEEMVLLVDEAHNLVDRGRAMFSADLEAAWLRAARRRLGRAMPGCSRAMKRLEAALGRVGAKRVGGVGTRAGEGAGAELDLFGAEAGGGATGGQARGFVEGEGAEERVVDSWAGQELPAGIVSSVDGVLAELEAWLVLNCETEYRVELLELYFRLHGFRRTADLYDERFVTIRDGGESVRVRLYCLDPAGLLRAVLDRVRAAVFFSATLTPLDFYVELLGGEEGDRRMRLASPFDPSRLRVMVHGGIRTQLKARAESLEAVVESIGAVVGVRPGNYLVYLPSYAYLGVVADRFAAEHAGVSVVRQSPSMSEEARADFLGAFELEPRGTRVGFAVLGGVFGEGIDLVGERLIGVVVVGVGLPQLSFERDLIRDYFDARAGQGFEHAYTYPGMNRVLQAAGRIIRSESDRGVLLLLDARFEEARYRRLFPAEWKVERVRSAEAIELGVRGFWGGGGA
jgi:DNA excision repair protein ERCC-2